MNGSNASPEAGRRRWRFRITLRLFLVLVLLLQIPLGYAAYLYHRAARESRAMAHFMPNSQRGLWQRYAAPLSNVGSIHARDLKKSARQQFFAERGLEEYFYPVTQLSLSQQTLGDAFQGE